MIMDMKSNKQVGKLTSPFNDLEVRMQNEKLEWKAALGKEGGERRADMAAFRADTQKLADKVHDIENAKHVAQPSVNVAGCAMGNWAPDHTIIGDRTTTAGAEESIAFLETVLASLKVYVRGRHLRPDQ